METKHHEKKVCDALSDLTLCICKNGLENTVRAINKGGTMFATGGSFLAMEEVIVGDLVLGAILITASKLQKLGSMV